MLKRNDKVAQLLTDDSFLRWINGEATPVEQQKWDRWLEEDPANIHLIEQAKELSRSLQFDEEQPDTMGQLKRLEKALDRKENRKQMVRSIRKNKSYWTRAAAVIVLLVAILTVIQYANRESEQHRNQEIATIFETIQTDYGETKKLTFSDSSEITLNARSTLTYPVKHTGGDMEVELQGEAYFSIDQKSGEQQRTFSVKTPEGRIAVLGTKFNVNTYSQNTEIVLEEGKVQVKTSETSKRSGQAYTMSPSELVRLQPGNREIEVLEKVDTELYTSWTNLELKFNNTPLEQIAERIEQIYGVDVEFRDERLKKVEFSGTAPSENVAVLLEGLRTLLDIPIVHEGNTITFGE